MAIKAKISVDNSELQKGLKDAEKQANKAGSNIKSSMENAGKGFESINKLGGKMGGAAKNVIEAFTGVLSPIGLATAAIAGLGTLAVKVWDMMTVSAEEYAMKASAAAEKAKKNFDDTLSQQDNDAGYLERLKELSQVENMSNEMKMEAVALIAMLTKKYGDLGLSIDMASGKITGLDDAQRKFLKSQQEMKVDAAKINFNAQKMVADSATENAIGKRNVNAYVAPIDFGDATKSANVSRAQKWNQGGLEGKMEVANDMMKNATTSDDIKKWQTLSLEIQKMILCQKELNSIVEYGERSEKAYADALKRRSEESAKASGQSYKDEAKKTKEAREKTQKQDSYSALPTVDEKISYKTKENDSEQQKRKKLDESIAAEQEKLKALQAKQKELESKIGKGDKKADDEYIDISTQVAKSNAAIAKSEAERQESLTASYNIEKEIASLKKKYTDYEASQNSSTEMNVAKISGNEDRIRELELINDLKAKGIITDEKEIEKIKEKYNELLKNRKANEEKVNQASIDKMATDTGNQNEIKKAELARRLGSCQHTEIDQ